MQCSACSGSRSEAHPLRESTIANTQGILESQKGGPVSSCSRMAEEGEATQSGMFHMAVR